MEVRGLGCALICSLLQKLRPLRGPVLMFSMHYLLEIFNIFTPSVKQDIHHFNELPLCVCVCVCAPARARARAHVFVHVVCGSNSSVILRCLPC